MSVCESCPWGLGARVKSITVSMMGLFFRRLLTPLSALNAVPNGGCRYSGDYHDGKAVYYYDDSSDGRIYNGSFRFSRKYYVLPQGKVVETAIGCFAGDMKEGEWRFSKKSRDVKSVLTVEYAAGLRSGCYYYRSVCSSRAFVSGGSDILLRMRVENNHPVDAVECVFDYGRLTGGYDSEGRPDGSWTLVPVKKGGTKTYYEVWEHGECRSSYAYDNSTGRKVEARQSMPELVAGIVRRECLSLEKIMFKGAYKFVF